MCDLTSKLLKLVHHAINCMFEARDFRVLFGDVDEHFFAEVAISHGSNDRPDLPQNLLVCGIDLGIFLNFSLQLLYRRRVAQSVQRSLGCALLMRELCLDTVDEFSLALDFFRLLVNVLTQESELLLGQVTVLRFTFIFSKDAIDPAR